MNYIKEGTRRGLIGILMALFLSYSMLLLSSLGQDTLSIDVSGFVKQYAMYALSGFYLAFISVYFSIKKWSISRQFATHLVSTLPFLPIAYYIGMMPHTLIGMTIFIGFFLSSYAISFMIYKQYSKKQANLNAISS